MAPSERSSHHNTPRSARSHHSAHHSKIYRPSIPSPLNPNSQRSRANQNSKPGSSATPNTPVTGTGDRPKTLGTTLPAASTPISTASVPSNRLAASSNGPTDHLGSRSAVHNSPPAVGQNPPILPALPSAAHTSQHAAPRPPASRPGSNTTKKRKPEDDLHEEEEQRRLPTPADPSAPAVFAGNIPSLIPSSPGGSNRLQETSKAFQEARAGISGGPAALPDPPPATPVNLTPTWQPHCSQTIHPLDQSPSKTAASQLAKFDKASPPPFNSLQASCPGPRNVTGSHAPATQPLQQPNPQPFLPLSGNLLNLFPTIGHMHPPNQTIVAGGKDLSDMRNKFPIAVSQQLYTQIDGYPTLYTMSREESELLHALAALCKQDRPALCNLVGLFLVAPEIDPNDWLGQCGSIKEEKWRPDLYAQDLRDKHPEMLAKRWQKETAGHLTLHYHNYIWDNSLRANVLGKAIGLWAEDSPAVRNHAMEKIDQILRMPEGAERNASFILAQSEVPKVWNNAIREMNIGLRTWEIRNGERVYQSLKPGTTEYQEPRVSSSHFSVKRLKMDGSYGRPVQVHSVPPEERAIDSSGKRLPWALHYHDSLPMSHGQRRPPEEKGPFGKSTRRKATSRTRTATPAKKENPAVDAFSKAMQYDAEREARSGADTPNTRLPSDLNPGVISAEAQPTQVIIFGYSSESQWAALDGYEKISAGMICEDYSREPPNAKRYGAVYRLPGPKRTLTPAERAMKAKYDGGEHWVKVTFDSKEAAERALESSPRKIYGHWVYARMYYGLGPENDEPIPVKSDELGSPSPNRHSSAFGSSIQHTPQQDPTRSTQAAASLEQDGTISPDTTSTATSATATGVEYPDLRQRQTSQTDSSPPEIKSNPKMMRHFPDQPRYILRPAAQAFAPQLGWWERQFQALRDAGLWPQNMFDNAIIKKDDGSLDFTNASIYWRVLYFLDSVLHTDLCQLHSMD